MSILHKAAPTYKTLNTMQSFQYSKNKIFAAETMLHADFTPKRPIYCRKMQGGRGSHVNAYLNPNTLKKISTNICFHSRKCAHHFGKV